MPDRDLLSAAVEELYSLDPNDFLARRGALAARARQDGDAQAARAITALRRPTKAAWFVNRLVRAEPDVAAGLAELGGQLRKAQRALDGAALRELTQQRRKLIDAATRKAFGLDATGEPSTALRQEVSGTLEAALADAEVAELFAAGTLVRAAQWSGFGESAPALSAVADPRPSAGRGKSPTSAGKAKAAVPRGPATGAAKGTAVARDRRPATPSAEQRRQQQVEHSEQLLAAADTDLQVAASAEQEREEHVARLAEQLADARRRLDEARLDTRQARGRQREAQRRLERARH